MRYLWCQLLGGWTRKKEWVLSSETQVSLPRGRSSPCEWRLGVNCRHGSRGSVLFLGCADGAMCFFLAVRTASNFLGGDHGGGGADGIFFFGGDHGGRGANVNFFGGEHGGGGATTCIFLLAGTTAA